jgi:peptidoglycan L-alanyl-D-glutamate endopeptidase CwlK
MPRYSRRSKERLATCHMDLRKVFSFLINRWDFSILCGHRNEIDQTAAYEGGNSKLEWPNSKHNQSPSMAIDAVPWRDDAPHIDWEDRDRFIYFAGVVVATAEMMFDQGIISHRVRWGGDWDLDTIPNSSDPDNSFDDLGHFELYKPRTE